MVRKLPPLIRSRRARQLSPVPHRRNLPRTPLWTRLNSRRWCPHPPATRYPVPNPRHLPGQIPRPRRARLIPQLEHRREAAVRAPPAARPSQAPDHPPATPLPSRSRTPETVIKCQEARSSSCSGELHECGGCQDRFIQPRLSVSGKQKNAPILTGFCTKIGRSSGVHPNLAVQDTFGSTGPREYSATVRRAGV